MYEDAGMKMWRRWAFLKALQENKKKKELFSSIEEDLEGLKKHEPSSFVWIL